MSDPERMARFEREAGDTFVVKAERPLFEVSPLGVSHYSDFDVSSDGSEFIFVRHPEGMLGVRKFTVVQNWFEEFTE